MKTMKTLAVLLLALFAFALPAAAQVDGTVGGVELIVFKTGTSAGTAVDVTWDTPSGFIPSYIWCQDDTAAQSRQFFWSTGADVTTAKLNTESSGIVTYVSQGGGTCWFDMSTVGTIIIDAACQTNSKVYSCFAIR